MYIYIYIYTLRGIAGVVDAVPEGGGARLRPHDRQRPAQRAVGAAGQLRRSAAYAMNNSNNNVIMIIHIYVYIHTYIYYNNSS